MPGSCQRCPDHHSTTRVGAQSWNDDNHVLSACSLIIVSAHVLLTASSCILLSWHVLHHCTVAVQWSHDDSALPGTVKAALESRPAGGTSQAALPEATASQQQVRGQVDMLCTLGCCWCVLNCSNQNLTLRLCDTEHSAAQEACVLC